MKSLRPWLFATVLIVASIIIIAFNAGGPDRKTEPAISSISPKGSAATPLTEAKPTASVRRSAPAPASGLPEEPASDDAILSTIHDASISYDPVDLPKIRPYLLHPNPEVRQAAVDGMLVLGDAAASTLLREAARQIPVPKEAMAMLEAADYLELPSGTGLKEKPVRLKSGMTHPSRHR